MSFEEPSPIRAPELTGGIAWLNTDRPLSLSALRGKIVLLDFWTYGCINCMHVLPDLRRLEERFRDELVVIGVHSAKFPNERDTENLRRVVRRYGITHPVVNDAEMRIWRAYTVRAWPTLVIVDPAGYVVGAGSGEGHGPALERAIAAVAAVFDEKGTLDRRPLEALVAEAREHPSELCFPGKIVADDEGGRLFVADTNHHRILVTTLDGRQVDAIGSGGEGADDGSYDAASFSHPQGLALAGGLLFVADTGNHLIRLVDLDGREVMTSAGTGRQASHGAQGGSALESSLNSPWDVARHGSVLLVAMAGPHQIWLLDLARQLVWPYAGTGAEARLDGPIDASAFAQPSGLAIEGDTLFVADAEGSTVRAVALPPANVVTTVCGGNLFDFGDRDGVGDDVRFQHPLGLAAHGGRIYVADTYNHKIKVLDPVSRRVTTLAGTGRPGHRDGPPDQAEFWEPGGLSVAGGTLYVADTNNHAVRTVDLATGMVATLSVGRPG